MRKNPVGRPRVVTLWLTPGLGSYIEKAKVPAGTTLKVISGQGRPRLFKAT